jgi:hypothetical protein
MYGKPVGASDGCGTVILDAAALARRLAGLEEAHANLKDDLRAAITRNRYLRKALKTCIARAGAPDPVEACRLVIRTAEKALGEE